MVNGAIVPSDEPDLYAAKLAEKALSYKLPSPSSRISLVALSDVSDNTILPGFIFSPNKSLPTLIIEADVCNYLLVLSGFAYSFPCVE